MFDTQSEGLSVYVTVARCEGGLCCLYASPNQADPVANYWNVENVSSAIDNCLDEVDTLSYGLGTYSAQQALANDLRRRLEIEQATLRQEGSEVSVSLLPFDEYLKEWDAREIVGTDSSGFTEGITQNDIDADKRWAVMRVFRP